MTRSTLLSWTNARAFTGPAGIRLVDLDLLALVGRAQERELVGILGVVLWAGSLRLDAIR